MPPQLKNPYGVRDGALLTADIVERGLACRCTCPQCGERLVANHGSGIKQPYFSHESGSECGAAYETALHLLAKEVLGEERRILLPPLRVEVGAVLANEAAKKKHTLTSRFVVLPAELAAFSIAPIEVVAANCYQRFDRVELEVFLDEIVPDVVMHVANRTLLVEILVTHPVPETKKRWLKENGLPMIEFDFSGTDRTIGKPELKRAFLQPRRPVGHGSSKWIHHPKAHQIREAIERDFETKCLDRLDGLLKASDSSTQAVCTHDMVIVVMDDGVRRSICRKCSKFFGRVPE